MPNSASSKSSKVVNSAANTIAHTNVMPDCCHIGVIVRTLLALNLTVLVALVLQAGNWKVGFSHFFESAMLLEWSSLLSLGGLCAVRKGLLWRGWLLPESLQRCLCALVPMVLVGGMSEFLLTVDWFVSSFPRLTLPIMAGLAALFGLILQHYFELRTRAYSPALSEARLQALQARIRPHFLFNSLNAVLSLIRTEPLRAETTLEDLADLFRVLMRETRDLCSLGEEIHLCRQYLSIEKIRLGERLQVHWHLSNITETLLQRAKVPILLLQPLLENAVYYGVECSTATSVIVVKVTRSLDRIEIVVTNPVHTESKRRAGNQMALINIQERLALLYDVEAQLTFGAVGQQFEVRLLFPYVRQAAVG